jgi:16S rRNA (cytidine1402-2'-O)-methyltransferase
LRLFVRFDIGDNVTRYGLDEPNEGAFVDESTKTANATGQLVLVATPLGNLGDISRRALELLTNADVVYCEDTRHSSTLFSAHNIAVNRRLRSLHEHNEASLCDEIVERVRSGQVVVVISDAGTPGISDPGSRVAAAVAGAGLVVTTAPGPSAVIAALTISGLATERFVMEGFLPRKAGERELLYAQWQREIRTIVFYESPQRLATTLNELAEHFGQRQVAVAREITKLHEEVVRGDVTSVANTFAAREVLGEIVVVLEGSSDVAVVDDDVIRAALAEQLDRGESVRDAVAFVEEALGVAHRATYLLAIALRADEGL